MSADAAGARAGPVDPEPPALEGVGGKLDPPSAEWPVELDAVDPRLGEEAHERLGLGTAAAHRGDGEAIDGLAGQRRQNSVRAELEKAGHAVLLEPPDAVHEAHRLPDLTDPVLRLGDVARRGRRDRDLRR